MEALTEVTRVLEAADDVGGAEGAGDLLDDFVVTAASRVSSGSQEFVRLRRHGRYAPLQRTNHSRLCRPAKQPCLPWWEEAQVKEGAPWQLWTRTAMPLPRIPAAKMVSPMSCTAGWGRMEWGPLPLRTGARSAGTGEGSLSWMKGFSRQILASLRHMVASAVKTKEGQCAPTGA